MKFFFALFAVSVLTTQVHATCSQQTLALAQSIHDKQLNRFNNGVATQRSIVVADMKLLEVKLCARKLNREEFCKQQNANLKEFTRLLGPDVGSGEIDINSPDSMEMDLLERNIKFESVCRVR